MNREDVLKNPSYWFEQEQNELFRRVSEYMEKENINRTQLAERLKVGKSYVSQILNGNYNFSLRKWIELCLAIGIVPAGYRSIEDFIREDAKRKTEYSIDTSFRIVTHPATVHLYNKNKILGLDYYKSLEVAK